MSCLRSFSLWALGAATSLVPALAIPVFQSGTAGFVFDPGDGNLTSLNVNPIPLGGPVTQFNASNPAPLSAAASGGIWHLEAPDLFAISFPGGTGVSQMDFLSTANAATLTITFSATWEMNGQFGPVSYGFANFPSIAGVVGAGAGSYVQFDLDATWTGGATRDPVDFTYVNNTPGAFNIAFQDIMVTTPNFIGDGLTETISGTLTFTARGVEDLSSINLGQESGVLPSPVPEPEEYAALAGAALLGFALWRRRRQP